jgi:hypothetical protein
MATIATSTSLPWPRFSNHLGGPVTLDAGAVVGVDLTATQAAYIQNPACWVGGTVPFAPPAADPDPGPLTFAPYTRQTEVNGHGVTLSLATETRKVPFGAAAPIVWSGAEQQADYTPVPNSPGRRYDGNMAVPQRVSRGGK